MLDWYDIERLYDEQGLPPAISPTTDRSHVPGVRGRPGGRSARRPRTAGARSSSRRSRSPRSPPRFERVGTRLQVEWTVEGRRGRVNADGRRAAVPRPRAQARVTATTDASVDFAAFDRLVEARLERWTAELVEYLAIPSEGGDDAGLRAAADWTAERLRRLGATVEVLEVDGAPPLVVGEIGDGPRTVTAVQHYDVQPASPLELWTTPPYEPAIRDGRVWARGATDNKGEFLPRVWAVEAWLEAIGPLPCRVRYLVEGQEETGSGALDALLDLRPRLREADAALIEGGSLDMRGKPWVAAGGKGIVVLDLDLRTMAVDSHSSVSSLLPNAGQRHGRGARDAVGRRRPAGRRGPRRRRPSARPTPSARSSRRGDLRDLDDMREHQGIERFTARPRRDRRRRGADASSRRSTCRACGPATSSPTPKTVIPAEAHARIDIRIVPGPAPRRRSSRRLRRHLDEHGFGDVEIVEREGEPAWWTPVDHPVVVAVRRRGRGRDRPVGRATRCRCRARCRCTRCARAHRVPLHHAGRGPRRLRRPRAEREHPDRGPRDGHPDHGSLPRPVRPRCPRSRGSPSRPRLAASAARIRASSRPRSSETRNGRSSPRREPLGDRRVLVHERERRRLVGRLEHAQPGVRAAERRPDEHDRPSSNRRWIRAQWRPQTSFSASVIVSAKSSRGGWMK